jgi:predicted amidophosphoribosyltransferase
VWQALRPWLFPVWCIACGLPETALCRACARASARPFTVTLAGLSVRAAGEYGGTLRDAILALKRGERAFIEPLAALLAALVAPGAMLVPVPTTSRRAAARGFDQARELARQLAIYRAGLSVDVLKKRGAAQRGLGRGERLHARGRFTVRSGAAVPPQAVLVDDVLTTGATLLDAARVLSAAGCRVLGAVVVARTPPGRETPRGGGRLVEA